MMTDNAYQSMFLVTDSGVVVVDAPPSYAAHIRDAIASVTDKRITHLVYSHSHVDHIGGAKTLGGSPIIVAHDETARLLKRAADSNRPLPTVTFADRHCLKLAGKTLELSYHGNAHAPGNIFISAPEQRVLMVVDVVFPGWMPWRRFALAQDIPAHIAQVDEIGKMDWSTFVGGRVGWAASTCMSGISATRWSRASASSSDGRALATSLSRSLLGCDGGEPAGLAPAASET